MLEVTVIATSDKLTTKPIQKVSDELSLSQLVYNLVFAWIVDYTMHKYIIKVKYVVGKDIG